MIFFTAALAAGFYVRQRYAWGACLRSSKAKEILVALVIGCYDEYITISIISHSLELISLPFWIPFLAFSLFTSSESRPLKELAPDCVENSAIRCDLGGCIDKSKVCDFHSDCPLGEDEGFICGELDSAFESFYRSVKDLDNILLCNICLQMNVKGCQN